MTILLAGATGLVGSRVLVLLLAAGKPVVTIGRRATGNSGAGLVEIVADFARLPELPAAEVAICALGTTIAAAGSQAAFRAVDHDAVLAFAAAAKAAGVAHFIVVTAVGADAGSGVFYSRVKGEVEHGLAALGFARLDLLQPGLIIGPRSERRPLEAFFQWLTPLISPMLVGGLSRYGSIGADRVAAAAVALAEQQAPGVFRHQNDAMSSLAAT